MFSPSNAWVERNMRILLNSWGRYNVLPVSDILSHLGEHTYNLQAAQHLIEKHIWGGEVSADVTVKFIPLSDIPGRITLVQTWSSRKIKLQMTIEVADEYRSDPGAQMAILAHEYAHAYHYLRDDFTPPDDLMEYENLTDLSTVVLGLGELLLQGQEVGAGKRIGYLPKKYLLHADEIYRVIKKEFPESAKSTKTTLAPGTERNWSHEEPKYSPLSKAKHDKVAEEKNSSWNQDSMVVLFPNSGKAIKIKNQEIFGRSFAKSNRLITGNQNKISREQIQVEVRDGVLFMTNMGKHPVEIRYSRNLISLGFFNLGRTINRTIKHSETVSLPFRELNVYLPECEKFVIK